VPSGVTTGPVGVRNGSGATNFSATNFMVIGRGPYITDFSPTYGVVGDQVLINGVHFTGTTAVKFGVTSATSFAATSDTQITAYVPAGATNGLISVTTPNGSFTNTNTFTVVGPGPFIASFSPTSGNISNTVTITGLHFTTATAVKFNGASAPFAPPTTDTSLIATVPTNATSGPITVSNTFGGFTTSSNFYLPPVITSFSPTNGRAGTNVVIIGTSFSNASVTFNGLSATFNLNSSTQITAIVPAGVTTGPIQISTPGGANPPNSIFTVLPTISSFSPGFGPVGTIVTITGVNLSGATAVSFNGIPSATFSVTNDTTIGARVPAGATSGPISVTTPDGTATSIQNFYLPPGISFFSPTNSAPGTIVTITGANFTNASAVSFNGAPAAGFGVTNNTTIGAIVPAGVITGPISVTTPVGTTNSADFFYGAPVIFSFNPTHGFPGTNVTILGTNFLGATAVKFNGSNAMTFSVSTNNGTIQATVPNNAITGPITVTAPAGTATTTSNFNSDLTSDLAVSVTASPNPVFVTSNLVYTITVMNNGPFDAPNVVLSNMLPASVSILSATNTSGTLNTNRNPVIDTIATIGVNNSAILTLTVVPRAIGTITNTATVASAHSDPMPANNVNTLTTLVLPLPVLSIQRYSANQVEITWPAVLNSYFTLQSAAVLTTGWTNVPTPPIISGTNSIVIDLSADPAKFYRLKQ
jgi:large repetitive protein